MSREKALKRINQYLAKQEVKKLKLSIVNEIDTLFREVVKNETTIENLSKELRSVSIRTAVKIEKMRKLRDEFNTKAKELGVDPDTVIASGWFARTNNLMKAIQQIKKI